MARTSQQTTGTPTHRVHDQGYTLRMAEKLCHHLPHTADPQNGFGGSFSSTTLASPSLVASPPGSE